VLACPTLTALPYIRVPFIVQGPVGASTRLSRYAASVTASAVERRVRSSRWFSPSITLRAHEALSRLDALSGFLEVVHRLFENGVFVGHDRSIRTERRAPITRLLRLLPRASRLGAS
jgi:hypothetical protein